MLVTFAVFPTLSADPIAYQGTWQQLVDFVRHAPASPNDDHNSPLIKLATLGTERSPKGHLCHDSNITAVYGIEGDYDAGHMPPEQAVTMLQLAGLQCLIFTTKRHTASAPRWRILCPLSKPYAPADRKYWAERLNTLVCGVLAPETGRLTQRYYYGPRAGMAAPLVWSVEGQPLDVVATNVPPSPWVSIENRPAGAVKPADWDEKTPEQQAECLADLRDALRYLDPDDRDSWVARGQELAGLGDIGREMWEEWSLTSKRDYPNGNGFEKFDGFGGARTDYRAIFAAAERNGWKNPASSRAALARFGYLPDPVAPPAAIGEATVIDHAPQAEIVDGATLMFPDVQIPFFKGCVWIEDINRIRMPDGRLLDKARFDVVRGGYSFSMDSANSASPSKSAWDCFTMSQAIKFPKVNSTCFRPELAPGRIIQQEGMTLVNTYMPITTERTAGDPTPFIEFMRKLFPIDRDFRIHASYMAALVQNPGRKFQWWPVIQGGQGNGKTILATVLTFAVGQRYTHSPNVDDMARNGGKFNGWIDQKLLICMEEIYVSKRRDFLEAFKSTVTNLRLPVENKGVDQKMTDNRANGIMLTNHKDGVPITIDDRRYCVTFTAQQTAADIERDGMGGDYFPDLHDWLNGRNAYASLGENYGFRVVNNWLHEYVPDGEFNPAGKCQRAPRSSSFREAVDNSRGHIEQSILDAIEEGRQGFRGGFISSHYLDELLKEHKSPITQNRRVDILKQLGYDKHPALNSGRTNNPVIPDGKKIKIYADVNSDVYKLQKAPEVEKLYSDTQKLIYNLPF